MTSVAVVTPLSLSLPIRFSSCAPRRTSLDGRFVDSTAATRGQQTLERKAVVVALTRSAPIPVSKESYFRSIRCFYELNESFPFEELLSQLLFLWNRFISSTSFAPQVDQKRQ